MRDVGQEFSGHRAVESERRKEVAGAQTALLPLASNSDVRALLSEGPTDFYF